VGIQASSAERIKTILSTATGSFPEKCLAHSADCGSDFIETFLAAPTAENVLPNFRRQTLAKIRREQKKNIFFGRRLNKSLRPNGYLTP